MSKYNVLQSLVISLTVVLISACSSNVKKADIPNTANPQEEVGKLDADINAAVLKNIDVLAKDEFEKTVKLFDEAKSDLDNKKNQDEILEDVRTGRGYLEQAYAVAGNRETKAATLFQARQAALTAGAGMHPQLRSELKDVDGDVSSRADKLETLSAEATIKLQNRYIELEKNAVVLTQLATPQAIVNGARKDGATRRAPMTLKKAEVSLKNAEGVISTNMRNPTGFESAVTQAKADAVMLSEVMTTIMQNGKSLPEGTAVNLVMQNRQIKKLKTTLIASERAAAESAAAEALLLEKNKQLSTDLTTKDGDLAATKKDLSAVNDNLNTTKKDLSAANTDLSSATKELSSAQASVEVQRAIETARQQFSADEAEAYQQGNSLLIRLKKVNFASGQAQLPGASLPVLAKVSEVAKQLKASGIKVEGHTDSTGTAEKNKTISEERAQAVATYFKSNGFQNIDVQASGYGFQKPIATNKSKEGRALNRRVDIIITPEGVITK